MSQPEPHTHSAPCSYNRVNGSYACGLGSSLNRNLKGDLNWTGFITSDWSRVGMCCVCVLCVCVCACVRVLAALYHCRARRFRGAVHADGYQEWGLDMDQPGTDSYFRPDKLQGGWCALIGRRRPTLARNQVTRPP